MAKNGTPTSAVTTPTGRLCGAINKREAISASTIKMAPANALAISNSAMQRAKEEAHNMRNNQPHKANGTGHADNSGSDQSP